MRTLDDLIELAESGPLTTKFVTVYKAELEAFRDQMGGESEPVDEPPLSVECRVTALQERACLTDSRTDNLHERLRDLEKSRTMPVSAEEKLSWRVSALELLANTRHENLLGRVGDLEALEKKRMEDLGRAVEQALDQDIDAVFGSHAKDIEQLQKDVAENRAIRCILRGNIGDVADRLAEQGAKLNERLAALEDMAARRLDNLYRRLDKLHSHNHKILTGIQEAVSIAKLRATDADD